MTQNFVDRRHEVRPIQQSSGLMFSAIIFAVIVALFVGGMWGYAYYLRREANASLSRIQELEKELQGLAGVRDKARDYQKQIQNIESLQRQHVYWTPILQEIQKITVQSVSFTSIHLDRDGAIVLQGNADSYSRVAEQMESFRNSKVFTDVDVNTASLQTGNQNSGRVVFTVNAYLGSDALFNSTNQ